MMIYKCFTIGLLFLFALCSFISNGIFEFIRYDVDYKKDEDIEVMKSLADFCFKLTKFGFFVFMFFLFSVILDVF